MTPRRALLAACCALQLWCGRAPSGAPAIHFTRLPPADEGGGPTMDAIEGRVRGARPGQQLVLYAKSGPWWVQPFVERPFTALAADGSFMSSTHLGTHYAALLVEPGYRPLASIPALPGPGNGVVTVALERGTPALWQTPGFRLALALAALALGIGLYRYRLFQLSQELQVRFEERLAERTRIAQELHDTLLQGFLSVAMHLDVAVQRQPEGGAPRAELERIASLIARVVEEGRNAVRGLRTPDSAAESLEQALARTRAELATASEETELRVIVHGRPRALQPAVRDEVYRIGREAVANAFRHSGARSVEVEVEYAAEYLRLLVRDEGRGLDMATLQAGRAGHWGLTGMRERAEKIGAHLRLWSKPGAGTEVEVSLSGSGAYADVPAGTPRRWWTAWRR